MQRKYTKLYFRGTSRPEVFPIGNSDRVSEEGRQEGETKGEISTAITTDYRKGVHSGGETYIQDTKEITQGMSDAQRVYESEGLAKTLKGLGGGQGAKTGLYLKDARIRRLTPTECERLQGFPDGWTAKGIMDGKEVGMSDTRRYKALGNAVTVNVIV